MERETVDFHGPSKAPKKYNDEEREGFERVLLFIHTLGFLLEDKRREAIQLTSTDIHRIFPQFALMMRWDGEMYRNDAEGRCPAANLYFGEHDKDGITEYTVNPLVQHILFSKKIEGLSKTRLIEAGESVFKLWLP